jgi:hypothetical protein
MTAPIVARIRMLIRFHMAAGGRVALRANAVVAAVFVFVFGSAPDGLATLRTLVLGTVSAARGWSVLAIFTGVCLALAAAALPRITLGLGGWTRSLPASRGENRRAAIIAVAAAQLFSLAWTVLAVILTLVVYRAPLSLPKLIAIPAIVLAVATFVVRTADRNLRRRKPTPIGVWRFARNTRRGWLHWVRFSWAALPASAIVGAAMLPAVFIAFAFMIVRRNPDLPPATAHRTVRIAGTLAAGALAASLSNALLRLRPTWAWSRSLPWSSTQRVTADAITVGAPVAVAVATLLPLDAWNALAVLAIVPGISAAGARALRFGATRQTGAAGEVVIAATIAGVLIAMSPLLAVVPLLATPVILRFAGLRDRHAVASRFAELQHDASADSAWLGAR